MDSKVVSESIKENGTADFLIPVTNHTKLKLLIPEGGIIGISSLRIQSPCKMIEYDYDGPYVTNDASGNETASYIGMHHIITFITYHGYGRKKTKKKQ